MRKQKTVTFNFIMNAILTCSNILFPLITYPYVSRILKPYGMGMVSFANAIITYFTMFAQLGIPTYGIRICAKIRDNKEELSRTVQEIMIINMITCVISYVLFFIVLFVTPDMRQEKTLFLVMSISVVCNTIGVEWLYKGLEEYSYITVRSIIFKAIALVGIFAFVHGTEDYEIYGFLTVFALCGSYVVNFLNLRKRIIVKPLGNYQFRRHLKPIFIFFGMSIATTIYTNMDSVMIGFINGADENGCYDAAVKIKNLLVSVVTSLGTVLLPRVSYHWERGEKTQFWKLANKAVRFEMVVGGSMAVFFMIFAEPTIYIVSGELYQRAILPMQIIMPTLLLIGISTITGIQVMVPIGMESEVLKSEIVGAVVNLIINSLLIPKNGAVGAAIGTLAAEAVVLAYQIRVMKTGRGTIFHEISYGKIVISIAVAAAGGIAVRQFVSGNFAALVIGCVVYFGLFGGLLLLFKEPTVMEGMQRVKSIIKR